MRTMGSLPGADVLIVSNEKLSAAGRVPISIPVIGSVTKLPRWNLANAPVMKRRLMARTEKPIMRDRSQAAPIRQATPAIAISEYLPKYGVPVTQAAMRAAAGIERVPARVAI